MTTERTWSPPGMTRDEWLAEVDAEVATWPPATEEDIAFARAIFQQADRDAQRKTA